MQCLQIPEKIVCQQRTTCSGMEGLCILLKRLAYPCRYTDMVSRFGRNPTELNLSTVLDNNYEVQGPFKERQHTPEMQAYNKAMTEVRVSVEWMFGNITKYFSFVDFRRQMKVNLSAVGKMYFVSTLLENAHTCLYGNIVSKAFQLLN